MNPNTPQDLEARQDALKKEILSGLPPANTMVQRAIDMCLDRINEGYEVAHYREVLKKLSKINDRSSKLKEKKQ